MNFIDKVRLFLRAGSGGSGCLSFHREKYVEFGGPDGGDGGAGGDITLEATDRLTTLMDLVHRPRFSGKDGSNGKGGKKAGLAGEESLVYVPCGTMVYKDSVFLADLSKPGQRVLAARGGRGGRGNASFKTMRNTAPRIYEKGAPGEQATLDLELKLIADVGLAGFPNAGKSTLLARLTRARPKVADYPFTTLAPHLGVASHKSVHFVMADIPGLIEGASSGKGLGAEFLRHVERTRILVHLVDPSGYHPVDAVAGVRVIEAELKTHSPALARKLRMLVVSKMDLPGASEVRAQLRKRYPKRAVLGISAATGEGLNVFLDRLLELLARCPPTELEPHTDTGERVVKVKAGFAVTAAGEGRFKLEGPFVERASAMLDQGLPEAVARFQGALKRIGVDRALRAAGIEDGDVVVCGGIEFHWSSEPRRRLPFLRRYGKTRMGGPP